MARPKKQTEPIVGTGKDPEKKLTVQKSIPLFSLWRSDMSLAEFKILDTYLSRINSREPEKRTVVFTKGELEQLLGVTRINKPDLAARLKSLGRFVDLEEKNSKKVHQVALFEEAYGEMDANGQWTVKLTCTAKAMKYIFNIEELGYLRYKLRCITSLTSRYTYILFLYLEKNRTLHLSWDVGVDELRRLLNCDQDELYREFKFFNQRILKRCQKELHEKTECRFEYTPVKKGRTVTAVHFKLESIAVSAPEEVDPNQFSLFDEAVDPVIVCAQVLPGMNDDQVLSLYMAAQPVAAAMFDVDKPSASQVAAYLQQKVALMTAYNAKDPIRNKHSYLMKMVAQDLPNAENIRQQAKSRASIPGGPGWEPSLGQAEMEALQRVLRTAGNDPEIAGRAEKLKDELQGY